MLLSDVQIAIYERMEEKLETSVKDFVPEKDPLPYIVLGRIRSEPFVSKTTTGKRVTQDIFVFSEAEGKLETLGIVGEIEEAFEDNLETEDVAIVKQVIASESVMETDSGLFSGEVVLELLLNDEE